MSEYSSYKKNITHIKSIDGLRGVALLCVLMHHANSDVIKIALGNLGVVIFFTISGFLAYLVLHRDYSYFGKLNYDFFIYRRIIRIWPAYFTIILIVAFFAPNNQYPWVSLFTFTTNLDMAQFLPWPIGALTPLWSISVEEQFYVLAPFVYMAIKSRFRIFFSILIFITLIFIFFLYYKFSSKLSVGNGGIYYLPFSYAGNFIIGGLVARYYLNQQSLSAIKQIVFLVISLLVIFSTAIFWGKVLFPPYSIFSFLPYLILPFGCGALLISILPLINSGGGGVSSKEPDLIGRFFETPFLVKIGQLSYTMYLVHLFVLYYIDFGGGLMNGTFKNSIQYYPSLVIKNILYLSSCFVLAKIISIYIEIPMLKLRYFYPFNLKLPLSTIILWCALIVGIFMHFNISSSL
jgi:peptidoglycan/LPS O-acetylase OafA/YrhL